MFSNQIWINNLIKMKKVQIDHLKVKWKGEFFKEIYKQL